MEELKKVSDFLAPLPRSLPKDLIALKAPTALLCIPLPPWSSLKNLDETSGVVEDSPPEWISLDEDLGIDAYNRFRIRPRNEPIESWQTVYSVGIGPFARIGDLGVKVIQRAKDNDSNVGVQMSQDPFRPTTVTVNTYCEASTQFGNVLLEYTEQFPFFDMNDEAAWSIPRAELEKRLNRVQRLTIVSMEENWWP